MKKLLSVIIAIVAVAMLYAVSVGCAATGYTVFDGTPCFSDDILFSARIMGGRADYAHKRMTEVITDINIQASTTYENSDLCRFNAAQAGVRVEVGKHVYELFCLSLEYYALTDGAFNCAALPLSELWHVDASSIARYRPNTDGTFVSPELPLQADVEEVKAFCDPEGVIAEKSDGKYYLTKSDSRTRLDFGGIAKGYAVDECVKILKEYKVSSALIDISGNAYFYGRYKTGGGDGAWNVGVMSPRPRSYVGSRGYVCAVSLDRDLSAVTSGDYMRYYIHENVDGERVYVAHILGTDGVPIGVEYRDGLWRNADEWTISATVIGDSSALCDALSTAVCALGRERGGQLLQKVGYKGLIFTEKRFTIIGDVNMYKPDVYNEYRDYIYSEL